MAVENPLQVLVSGRRSSDLQEIESILRDSPNYRVTTGLLAAGEHDPLAGVAAQPEVLVLALQSNGTEPLRVLEAMPPRERPATLVVGPGGDLEMMRLAMRAGARDYLAAPVEPADLRAALERIDSERRAQSNASQGRLTVVVNAKGGSGASVIASNLAHMTATRLQTKTVLVDLDLQFGVLPLYFDLQANDGLIQAIESIDTLDEVAVEGWMLKHGSGLHLLGNSQHQLVLPGEVSDRGLSNLLSLLKQAYSQVILDLPKQIDPVFAAVMEQADRVILVLQQSLANLRHAKNLLAVMREQLALSNSQISVVVNRWERKGALTQKEIEQTLGGLQVTTLPNDWQRVTRSLDIGTPLLDMDPRAPITRELATLTTRLIGLEPEKRGLFGRLMNR